MVLRGRERENTRKDDESHADFGYTFTAIDPDTKLMPCWLVGERTPKCTEDFMMDLAPRLANRIQLTTDGWGAYRQAVDRAFGGAVDFAVEQDLQRRVCRRRRQAPLQPALLREQHERSGVRQPGQEVDQHQLVERANLSMPMGNRRLTRLTNAFSKKLVNHMHAMSFYFMVYNFVKIHSSIKTTPAMEPA